MKTMIQSSPVIILCWFASLMSCTPVLSRRPASKCIANNVLQSFSYFDIFYCFSNVCVRELWSRVRENHHSDFLCTPIKLSDNFNEGCNTTWKNFSNTAVAGIEFLSHFTTVDDCKLACLRDVAGCVAVQFVYAAMPVKCFIVKNANSLYYRSSSAGAELHVLIANCVTGTSGKLIHICINYCDMVTPERNGLIHCCWFKYQGRPNSVQVERSIELELFKYIYEWMDIWMNGRSDKHIKWTVILSSSISHKLFIDETQHFLAWSKVILLRRHSPRSVCGVFALAWLTRRS